MMSNHDNDCGVKREYSRGCKRRIRLCKIRDPNASVETFRKFYQSGGRDVEQYRRYLRTLAKSGQPSSSVDLNKIKDEPIEFQMNTTDHESTLSPLLSTTVHSQQPSSTYRIACTHPSLKSTRHLSSPMKSQISLPYSVLLSSVITVPPSSEQQMPSSHDFSQISNVVTSSTSSSISDWSVADVEKYIYAHIPEKHLARKFAQQKIDGRTLPLLTEDHLTRIFKMKLGPALHLLSLISDIQTPN